MSDRAVFLMDGDDVIVNGKRITQADVKREAERGLLAPLARLHPAIAERLAYNRLMQRAVRP
jgi:hypothetical protein